MFAGLPDVTDIGTLLSVVDGVLLTGARANVHPTFFNVKPNEKHEPYDTDRDHVALELTRACVEMGKPVFGLCRGIQEMNVAFGGTLHPEIRELPGRMNHRAPRLENGDMHPDPEVVFADRHEVNFVAGGFFSKLYGVDKIHVNSLHGQGIEEVGRRVVVEGVAEDGTIEAVRIEGASNFAIGVQWHAIEHRSRSLTPPQCEQPRLYHPLQHPLPQRGAPPPQCPGHAASSHEFCPRHTILKKIRPQRN